MSQGWGLALLGTVAGLCTTGSFLPQVIKTWREGDCQAISTRMYVIISFAFVLWLSYGLVIGSLPMVVFNILNLVLSGLILVLKLRAKAPGARRTASGSIGAPEPRGLSGTG